MGIDFKPKYYGSMVRVSVTTVKGGIEYIIHLEDVDAIPIEWIKKWLNETEDDRIVCFDIRDMLADWEKENEKEERTNS